MHCARCVGIPLTIQRRRRDCTDGSVLLLRRYVLELPTLSHNASQTQFRLLFFTLPRGKSIARHRGGSTRLSAEHAHYTKTAALKSSAAAGKWIL